MKKILIYFSYHHNNTEKIAQIMANVLEADLTTPLDINSTTLSTYELVGFGSGIYFGKHHKNLLNLVDSLPQTNNQKAFIISTSGQEGRSEKFHKPLREKLLSKGYSIIGEFNCPGYDTYALTKLVGGIKKGHPNQQDLEKATAFAINIKQKIDSPLDKI
jgi:flavodoxin